MELNRTQKKLFLALLVMLPFFSAGPANCANFNLEKTEFMPLEQVNVRVSVSGWFRPINVTFLLNGYPVATQTYDAGSSLYVSFLMPNGKPETISLRVIAWDCNQTHIVDSTATVRRVESNEAANIKMLMGNLTAARTGIEDFATILNTVAANINTVITSLNAISKLERETQGLLTSINGSVITEISNTASSLSLKLGALQEALATLKTDTEDVKTLATGTNEATNSGNAAITNVQTQVYEVHSKVVFTFVLSVASVMMSGFIFHRVCKLSKGSDGAKKPELQKEQNESPKPPFQEKPRLIRRIP